jgi:energy-coupling factor transport system substrate-specific component
MTMTAPTVAVHAVQLRLRSSFVVAVTSLVGAFGFFWPFLDPRLASSHSSDAPWLFVAIVPLLFAVVLAELGEGSLDAKTVAVLGVLAGVGAALRPLSGGATGFSFEFVLLILAGRALGRGFGFVLGALTLLASALVIAGVGPWLPFQMVGAAWIGFGAGCLPRASGRVEVVMLAAYGAVTGLLFGLLLNLSFWPFARYYPPQIAFLPHASSSTNLLHWLRFDLTTSLGFDVPRAVGNAALVLLVGRPVLAALHRVARRAAFGVTPAGSTAPSSLQAA